MKSKDLQMKRTKAEIFNDYEGFLEKFKPKKTTDDCYTPEGVYNAVVEYVRSVTDMSDKEIVRPFYPGGDYESYDYPDNAVVVDNPPFSIKVKIVRFYLERGIKFFLFAPHLTLFSGKSQDVTYIVTNSTIVYENGAIVSTDFITNLIPDTLVMTAPSLRKSIRDAQKRTSALKPALPKYEYPRNLVTAASLGLLVDYDVRIRNGYFITALDHQRKHKKGIFGGGFLVSDEAAETIEEVKQKREGDNGSGSWNVNGSESWNVNGSGNAPLCGSCPKRSGIS